MSLSTSGVPISRQPCVDEVQRIVLEAVRLANLARADDSQLAVSPDAALFGPESPLDSLGLLALLLDVEDGLQAAGCPIMLSDDRAMSQRRSPFRTVSSLVDYIGQLTRE